MKQEFRDVNGMLGEECEATQFEGTFTPHRKIVYADGRVEYRYYDEMCECNSYWDEGWGTPNNRAMDVGEELA